MNLAEACVYIAALTGCTMVGVALVQSLFQKPVEPSEAGKRALEELALLRDELSKLRLDTARDVGELRDVASKHERAFVNTTHEINSCLKEVSKLSLAYGQVRK